MAHLKKAYLMPLIEGRQSESIEVYFNPTEYALDKSNQYQNGALPGLANPVVQFVNGNAETLTMDLFFDTYVDGGRADVRTLTSRVTDLLDVDSHLHAPPVVRFVWGPVQFEAVIERVGQKFTMFLDDGTPVRATLSVTFHEYKTIARQLRELGLESADRTKRRLVGDADMLWTIAWREYGDVEQWRVIAKANDIEDPRIVEPGRELTLPMLRAGGSRP